MLGCGPQLGARRRPERSGVDGGCLRGDPTIGTVRKVSISKNEKIDRYAIIFKALSNPHRLRVFQRLASCCAPGTACTVDAAVRQTVGALGEPLAIAPSTVSHHLKELNRAGLVRMERLGKHVECSVEPAVLAELRQFFDFEPE